MDYITPVAVTASSQYGGDFLTANLIDGSTDTYWASANKTNQWVRFDLGEQKNIGSIKVWVRSGYAPETFDLYASDDDVAWQLMGSGLSGDPAVTWVEIPITFAARYVRLDMKTTPNTNFFALGEVMFGIVSVAYESAGDWTSQPIDLSLIDNSANSTISWAESVPDGATVRVACAISADSVNPPADGLYLDATNGADVPGITAGNDLAGKNLWTKIWLSTTDATKTPTVSNLTINVTDSVDPKVIQLVFEPKQTFANVQGDLTVEYIGANAIQGENGVYVDPFITTFKPTGLLQTAGGLSEQITAGVINPKFLVTRVYYKDGHHAETLTVGIVNAVFKLTKVDAQNP